MTAQRKNILLLAALLILFWVAYSFSFSKTLEARRQYNLLSKQSNDVSGLPDQLKNLKQQEAYFDSILDINKFNSVSTYQNNLLRKINSTIQDKKIDIIAFNEPHTIQNNETLINTYSFRVKGNFIDILNLIYSIEDQGNFGKILSINFKKSLNLKTKEVYLECQLLLQRKESLE